jgi:uncharacterized Zn finger protein
MGIVEWEAIWMQIIQKVVVKQVLTEESKKWLHEQFQQRKNQWQKECDQLRFEMKRLRKDKKYPPSQVVTYFEKEISNRQEKIKLLDFQLKQLELLPLGSEIKDREVQAIINVEVGDKWDEKTRDKTIVIKDGIVVDIR